MRDKRGLDVLRPWLALDAIVFLAAAAMNMGATIPLGFTALAFSPPVLQAGLGEAVIGVALLVAPLLGQRRAAWVAFWLSVIGIVFGLSSRQVQGLARDIHVVLVPLALIIVALLLWQGRQPRRRLAA